MKPFVLTQHAEVVVTARSISLGWITQVLKNPEKTEPDENDPTLKHALGRIPAHGDRVLRVVYNEQIAPVRIVTVYFDRSMRDKL